MAAATSLCALRSVASQSAFLCACKIAHVIASPVHVVAAQLPETVEFWQMFNEGLSLQRLLESGSPEGVPVPPPEDVPVGSDPVDVLPVVVDVVVAPVDVVVAPVDVVEAPVDVVLAPVVVVVVLPSPLVVDPVLVPVPVGSPLLVLVPVPVGSPVDVVLLPVVEDVVLAPLVLLSPVLELVLLVGGGGTGQSCKLSA